MKPDDFRINELVSFEPGFINLRQRRMVLHSVHAFAHFRRDLVQSLGVERAQATLTRFGWFAGQADAAALQRIHTWDSITDLLQACASMQTMKGAARSTFETLSLADDQLHLRMTWRGSAEAEEHLSTLGESDVPVCWILCGYASGYASFCLGRRILFIETRCLAKGDAVCVADGRPAEQWDDTWAQHKHRFEAIDVEAEIRRLSDDLRRKDELLRQRTQASPADISGMTEIRSPSFQRTLTLAQQVAKYDVPVLITGESGVGKEVLARHIHRLSERAGRPMKAVNCTSLPETLLESELFGHCAGAFTGATRNRTGYFEDADGGTLLLDEIGDISMAMQAKLLRVLQEHEITRVGETASRKVDVRILAATNRDLEAMVRAGRFRDDLFFRLRVVEIRIPPLRERSEDVLTLARQFVARAAKRFGKRGLHLDSTCYDVLLRHPWPGNIRELENAIERAAVLARDDRIQPEDLPPPVLLDTASDGTSVQRSTASLKEVEETAIRDALARHGGNRRRAAADLGISSTTLWRRLRH